MDREPQKQRTCLSKNSDKLSPSRDHSSRGEDPLSNYVVLQNIFSHLSNTDIWSCCQVNKCWNSIADPLFVRNYEVIIEKDHGPSTGSMVRRRHSISVDLAKISANGGKRTEIIIRTDLKYASKTLEAASRTRKISIDCTICACEEKDEALTDFLSKFGNFVTELSVSDSDGVTTRRLCEMLVSFFPNLEQLNLSNFCFKSPDDRFFDENLMENRMKHLKHINGYGRWPKVQSCINILRLAPNLEIHKFPILLVDALIETGKGHCVKSLNYQAGRVAEEEFRTICEKLAILELKLKCFDFYHGGDLPTSFCNAGIQPSVRRILDSSCDSLENLILYNTESFDFSSIGPMNALNTVEFLLVGVDSDRCSKLFPPEAILSNVFPKASNAVILTSLQCFSVSRIARLFPENQFAPWRIRKLELLDADESILQILSRAFPAVTDLEFRMEIVGLERIFGAIGEYWPEMEFLTVKLSDFSNYRANREGWSFDTAFTGIPKKDLALFGNDDGDTLFSSKEQENWRRRSPLRKLAKLKILKFDVTGYHLWLKKFVERFSAVTWVSKRFGFQFLPELQIVVRITRNEDYENWQRVLDMQACLEPLVNFKLEVL